MVETSAGRRGHAAGGGGEDGRERAMGAEAAGAHEERGDAVVVHGLRGEPPTGGSTTRRKHGAGDAEAAGVARFRTDVR